MTNQPAAASPPPRRRFHPVRWLLYILLTALAVMMLYTWGALTFSYSNGERAGYVQKFSRKGWVFKTWEGELTMVSMPGTTPEKFTFSVRSDSVAARINATLGNRVVLEYEQHIGIPLSWWGETEYFVTSVKMIEPAPGTH